MDGADRDLRGITRIVLRPFASALPLGFFGFGMGVAIVTAYGYGIVPPSDHVAAGLMMLAFAAPLEIAAAVFALLSRDAAAASAMGIFAASWVVNGATYVSTAQIAPDPASGVFTAMISLYLIGLCAISFRGKPMLGVFLVLATVRAIADAVMEFGGPPLAGEIMNGCGVLLVLASLYGGFAFLIEDVQHRELLPVFRRGQAKAAMQGGLAAQLRDIDREAGVRTQL